MRITMNEKELYSAEVLPEGQFESYANCGFSVLINPAGSFRFKNAVWKSFVVLPHKFSLIWKKQLFHKGLTRGDT